MLLLNVLICFTAFLQKVTAEKQGLKQSFALKTTKEYLNAIYSLMRLIKVEK